MAVLCKTPSGHYPVAMAAAHPHPNFLLPRRDKSLDFAMTFYQSRELVYVNCRFKIALVGQGQKKWYSCHQVVSMRETSTLTLQKLQIVSLLDTATTIIDKWNPPQKIGGFTSFPKTKWWKLEDILKRVAKYGFHNWVFIRRLWCQPSSGCLVENSHPKVMCWFSSFLILGFSSQNGWCCIFSTTWVYAFNLGTWGFHEFLTWKLLFRSFWWQFSRERINLYSDLLHDSATGRTLSLILSLPCEWFPRLS